MSQSKNLNAHSKNSIVKPRNIEVISPQKAIIGTLLIISLVNLLI